MRARPSTLLRNRAEQPERALPLVYAVHLVPFLLLALVPRPAAALAAMALVGVLMDAAGILATTAIQSLVPGRFLGRIFALMNVAMALGVVPVLLWMQPVVDALGPQGALLGAGLVVFLAGLGAGLGVRRSGFDRAAPVPSPGAKKPQQPEKAAR